MTVESVLDTCSNLHITPQSFNTFLRTKEEKDLFPGKDIEPPLVYPSRESVYASAAAERELAHASSKRSSTRHEEQGHRPVLMHSPYTGTVLSGANSVPLGSSRLSRLNLKSTTNADSIVTHAMRDTHTNYQIEPMPGSDAFALPFEKNQLRGPNHAAEYSAAEVLSEKAESDQEGVVLQEKTINVDHDSTDQPSKTKHGLTDESNKRKCR